MTEIKTEAERVGQCECEVCQYGREVRRHLAMLPEAARPFFENMYENLCYTENDLNYAQAVLDGSWPSAVPQLQRALDEAWKIARARGYDGDWPSGPLSLQDELVEAASRLIDDVRSRHPGEELHCPHMRALASLLTRIKSESGGCYE